MITIVLGCLCTVIGVLLDRLQLIKPEFSRLLSHSLYYLGLPLQIFVVAHNTKFIEDVWFPPLITIFVLLLGLILANLNLFYGRQLCYVLLTNSCKKNLSSWFGERGKQINLQIPQSSSGRGSFILASTLGSTGYLGLAIVPVLVNPTYSGWAVLYSITQILFGSFGLGVLVANYYGSSRQINCSIQLQELFKVPALWAFVLGWCSRGTNFALIIDRGLRLGVLLAIAGAFILTGIQIQRIRIDYLNCAIAPALLKMIVIPGLTGLCLTLFGVTGDARLSMVLMSGMPTANTNLILAQKYNLDSQVTASTIAVTTMLLPMMILMWKHLLQ